MRIYHGTKQEGCEQKSQKNKTKLAKFVALDSFLLSVGDKLIESHYKFYGNENFQARFSPAGDLALNELSFYITDF